MYRIILVCSVEANGTLEEIALSKLYGCYNAGEALERFFAVACLIERVQGEIVGCPTWVKSANEWTDKQSAVRLQTDLAPLFAQLRGEQRIGLSFDPLTELSQLMRTTPINKVSAPESGTAP